MKKTSIYISFLAAILLSCNTSEHKNKVNFGGYIISKDTLISQLANMETDTLDCSAEVYWKIIQGGKESIPALIESLTDTTKTNIFNRCKNDKLNIGEVSYFALGQIADFPTYIVTKIQFDIFEDGCWSFYEYLYDNKNKPEYQKMVWKFYQSNIYKYEKFKPSDLTECYKKYKIEGKYKWQE